MISYQSYFKDGCSVIRGFLMVGDLLSRGRFKGG